MLLMAVNTYLTVRACQKEQELANTANTQAA
jgi:cytochrome c oxidase cbb3-type subunit 1